MNANHESIRTASHGPAARTVAHYAFRTLDGLTAVEECYDLSDRPRAIMRPLPRELPGLMLKYRSYLRTDDRFQGHTVYHEVA